MGADIGPGARGSPRAGRTGGELEALSRLQRLLPAPPKGEGEVWFGDDSAAVRLPGPGGMLLLASDCVVAGLDAHLGLTTLADFGWKAMAVSLSDIAAMGGRPLHALVSVVGLGATELGELYSGILEASERYSCPVVGGDLSGGDQVVVSAAVTGWVEEKPVLRCGARPGDAIWVSGALGAAAAGLRLLEAGKPAQVGNGARSVAADLVRAHARPQPALAEGSVARRYGARAMIDVSDGFVADLAKLAEASGVGFDIVGRQVPVAPGASLTEALYGGDDYVLALTTSPLVDLGAAFAASGLGRPHRVGTCTPDASQHCMDGRDIAVGGWQHDL